MKTKTYRTLIVTLCVIIIITAAGTACFLYHKVHSPFFNIAEDTDIFINEKKDYASLLSSLKNDAHIKDIALFEQVAKLMKFNNNLKTGRYVVTHEMSCIDAVRMFRNGHQTPVKITFNNVRLKTDFADKIDKQLMFNKETLLAKMNDPEVCNSLGFDTATIIALFIPNTYEMYWNIPVDKFLERMKREYTHFWTKERLDKAKEIPLSQVEVATLASIVEEETALPEDYPIIAGLYINRLRKGMLLQADPTVKYAAGDFTLKRILYAHLEVESPYNTYKYKGLPPAPIRFSSIQCIDAVLNYSHHNYLFMTAKEDLSGKTNFAVTLKEHSRNARKYHEAINKKH
jgi:UPF0755 protein